MYKLNIHKMPMGYYIELEDTENGKYYFNNDIGKKLGVLYKGIVLQNGGFIEVSNEDLDGNEIEEYWFEMLEDVERVRDKLENLKRRDYKC